MKKFTLTCIMSALVLTAPAFADDAHHPEKAQQGKNLPAKAATKATAKVQSMPDTGMMMQNMQAMHEQMMNAKTPEARNALMAQQMKLMQDGMSMMGSIGEQGKMMGGMDAQGKMINNNMAGDMATRQHMMEKRMEMMESMMQMMIDREASSGSPVAPAK